jgi:hypothetical protein
VSCGQTEFDGKVRMSPEVQAKAEAQRLGEEMELAEVRRALKL